MSNDFVPGYPPSEITRLLRLEGGAVFLATLLAYQALGGNWWIFALLILAPDLSMLGGLKSPKFGARLYNLAHTYTVPLLIGLAAWYAGFTEALPYLLIWAAHIGLDRALGYGLKYPGLDHQTHLGPIGKAKKKAQLSANPA